MAYQRRPNAGIVWQGEAVSGHLSEAPNDAVEVSLSEILEPDRDPKYRLTAAHARKMLGRLERYGKGDNLLGKALKEFIRNSEASH